MKHVERYLHYSELVSLLKESKLKTVKRHLEREDNWTGKLSGKDALRLAEHGDPVTAEKIEKIADKLNFAGSIDSPMLTLVQDCAGGSVNIQDYLLGLPDCMVDFQLRNDKSKIIDIVLQGWYTGSTSVADIEARASRIAAIIQALQLKGFSCGIKILFRCSCSEHKTIYDLWVDIKSPGEAYNAPICAFWLANVAALRRMAFGFYYIEWQDISSYSGTYYSKYSPQENTLYFPTGEEWSADLTNRNLSSENAFRVQALAKLSSIGVSLS